MSSRKSDWFSEAVVGLFMLAVLLALGYFTIVISGVDILTGHEKVRTRVTFDQVGGLKRHDNVMYRGTKVGTVEDVEVTPTNLVVTLFVDSSVILREKCRASVASLSFLGGNYLVLEEGEGKIRDLRTSCFKGETPTDWMRDVTKIAANVRAFTGGDELRSIVTNMQVFTEKAMMVMERVERGEGTVGKFLSKDDTIYTDMQSTVAGAKDITERIQRGEGTVGRLMAKDDRVYNDISAICSNANVVTTRLREGKGLAGKILSEDDTLYNDLRDSVASFRKACDAMDFAQTKAEAEKLLANLNELSTRVKNGQGSLGKLVADDKMYNEVDGLIRDVRQVIDNYRDTTPISTFTSLAAGAL